MQHPTTTPTWTWITPLAGIAFFATGTAIGFGADFPSSATGIAIAILLAPLLLGAVFAAVYHAEDAAHQTGEPFGTLILTISVTVIELALILSVMLAGQSHPELVRDTVYAVIMIVTTGLVGACLLLGGLRYREQSFDLTSAKIYLAVLLVLASLTLILPNYTQTIPGPTYSISQLAFVSAATIALYLVFLYTQTILHRNYFTGERTEALGAGEGARRKLLTAIALLVLALAAIILLAKKFAIVVGIGVRRARRADGRDGRRHCTDRAAAGSAGRRQIRAQRRFTKKPEPGSRLVAGDHRLNRPRGGAGQHRVAETANPRP